MDKRAENISKKSSYGGIQGEPITNSMGVGDMACLSILIIDLAKTLDRDLMNSKHFRLDLFEESKSLKLWWVRAEIEDLTCSFIE
jgi:hypothetical protein